MPSLAMLFGATVRVTLAPALADEAALLRHLGMSPRELRKIWWFRHRMYHRFDVAKAGGKRRMITAPDARLKMLQRKIAAILNGIYRPRSGVHGFVADRSVKTNANSHIRGKFVVNLDLSDFFPTITEKRVVGLLEALGITERVAEVIARICCIQGSLPQGAPSSPVISNMICFRLDKQLQSLAKRHRCIYTRYADDITFSSYQPPTGLFDGPPPAAGKFSPDALAPELKGVFQDNGFVVNPDKAHYADKHSRRTVTGLRVNELVNLDRRFVRNVRALLFAVERDGIEAAQRDLNDRFLRKAQVGFHLQGKISWVGHIKGRSDPVFRGLATRYNRLFPDAPLDVLASENERRDRSVWVVEKWGETADDLDQGTAFFLKGVGLVTASHCVEGGGELELHHPTKPSNTFRATVRAFDTHRDLAILEHNVPELEHFYLEGATKSPRIGDHVVAVGYPGYGPGDRINVRPGSVSSLSVKSAVPLIEVTQKLTQGMSGGPVMDVDGRVVGIVHRGGPTEGRDFAVNVDALWQWLDECPVEQVVS